MLVLGKQGPGTRSYKQIREAGHFESHWQNKRPGVQSFGIVGLYGRLIGPASWPRKIESRPPTKPHFGDDSERELR